MKQREFVPNRLNFDAIVFCGCTMKEMQVITIVSLVVCMLILGFLTKLLFGMLLIGVGLAFPSSVAVVWFIAITYQKLKQGKPKGYIKQSFYLWLDAKKIMKSPFVTYSGTWSVTRRIK